MDNVNVAVIGGGPNGLIALYECKIRNIKAILYEKEINIGGVWNLNSSQIYAHKSTVFNTSSALSSWNIDFPLFQYLNNRYPTEEIVFPTISKYYDYLNDFIKHYQLESMILNEKEVIEIVTEQKRQEFILKVINRKNGHRESFVHNYVIFACGHYGKQIVPEEPFLSRQIEMNVDKVWHTSYWDPLDPDSITWKIMKKKSLRILLIGSGPSAGEALEETVSRSKNEGNYEKLQIFWAPTREPDKRNVWLLDFYPYRERNSFITADEISCRLFSYLPNWITSLEVKKILTSVLLYRKNANPDMDQDRIFICNTKLISNYIHDKIVHVLTEPIERIYKSNSDEIVFDTTSKKSFQVDVVVIGSGFTPNETKVDSKYLLENSRFYRNIIPVDKSYFGRIGYISTLGVLGSSFPVGQMSIKWLLYQWFDKSSNLQITLDKMRLPSMNRTPVGVLQLKKPPGILMDELARDMNVIPNTFKDLFGLSYHKRHLALACLLGPWSIFQYSIINETDIDKSKRENLVLSMTEKVYRKSGKNFRFLCFISDFIYFLIIGALSSFVYFNYTYLVKLFLTGTLF